MKGRKTGVREMRLAVRLIVAGVAMLALHVSQAGTQTSWGEGPPLRKVWSFENQELDISNSSGLLLASRSNAFYVVDTGQSIGSSPAGESGGRIGELSNTPPVAPLPGVPTDTATLVTTTHTYAYTPPSPDPSGLAYLSDTNSLLISDSEVNEIPDLFTGDNLFEVALDGALLRTSSTLSPTTYSDEPTGVAYNPHNKHLFISDDTGTPRVVYEIDLGADGILNTGDDGAAIAFDVEAYGVLDPEGIAFDGVQGRLFVADGADGGGEEIYVIELGGDGVLGGGDDTVTHFDTSALGITDPEGIEFNPDNGHLYILSGSDPLIAETEADGTLLRYIDLSAIDSKNLAGLAYAPASADPTTRHLYVVSRGVDNNSDPDENDGELYEVAFPLNIDNLPPFVDAGSNQTVDYPQSVTLAGTAADDGQPDPPGVLTTTWSQVSGPGTATFADPGAPTTTVSFSAPGRYVLRLTASDGELNAYDEVTIRAKPPGLLYLPLIRAEISPTGALNDGPE